MEPWSILVTCCKLLFFGRTTLICSWVSKMLVGKAAGMIGRQVLPLLQTAAGAEICAPKWGECPSLPWAEVRVWGECVSVQLTPKRSFKSIALPKEGLGRFTSVLVLRCFWTHSPIPVTRDTTLASLIRGCLWVTLMSEGCSRTRYHSSTFPLLCLASHQEILR